MGFSPKNTNVVEDNDPW